MKASSQDPKHETPLFKMAGRIFHGDQICSSSMIIDIHNCLVLGKADFDKMKLEFEKFDLDGNGLKLVVSFQDHPFFISST
jgi:hypothetical protein